MRIEDMKIGDKFILVQDFVNKSYMNIVMKVTKEVETNSKGINIIKADALFLLSPIKDVFSDSIFDYTIRNDDELTPVSPALEIILGL